MCLLGYIYIYILFVKLQAGGMWTQMTNYIYDYIDMLIYTYIRQTLRFQQITLAALI